MRRRGEMERPRHGRGMNILVSNWNCIRNGVGKGYNLYHRIQSPIGFESGIMQWQRVVCSAFGSQKSSRITHLLVTFGAYVEIVDAPHCMIQRPLNGLSRKHVDSKLLEGTCTKVDVSGLG